MRSRLPTDTLGKILLWAVGSLVVLVWGLSALVGSAVAVAGASEEGISWVLHHLPGLLLLAFMTVVASKIGKMLERALDYVRYELRYDLKRMVDR